MHDPFMTSVTAAAQSLQAQDWAAARAALTTLWEALDASARPDLACVVAHYMADTMEQPQDELAWDERALDAADAAIAAGMTTLEGVGSIHAFYPSLHLNLADVRLRLGDLDDSHLARARRAMAALPEDAYRELVRKGLRNLEVRLENARSRSAT